MKTAMIARFVLGASAIFAAAGLVGCGAETGQGPGEAIGASEQAITLTGLNDSTNEHRYAAFVVQPNSKLLQFGGESGTFVATTSVEEFAYSGSGTGTWSSARDSLKEARVNAEAVLVPGTDYAAIVGGEDASNVAKNTVELFNYVTNTMTKVTATMSDKRTRLQVVPCGTSANKKLLIIAGLDDNPAALKSLDVLTVNTATPASSTIAALSDGTNTIKLRTARLDHSATALDANHILIAGGDNTSTRTNESELLHVDDSCQAVAADYELVSGDHVSKDHPTFTNARTNGALVTTSTKVVTNGTVYEAMYFMGNESTGGNVDTTYVFDLGTKAWAAGLSIPTNYGRQRPPVAFNGTQIGIAGGDVAAFGGTEASTDKFATFDPAAGAGGIGLWASGSTMTQDRVGNAIAYLGGVFIAVNGVDTTFTAPNTRWTNTKDPH